MKKLICAILIGLCFFWILGTVGALECEMISLKQFVVRETSAFVLLYGSAWIGGFNK